MYNVIFKTRTGSATQTAHFSGHGGQKFQLMRRSYRIAALNSRALLANPKVQFRAEGIFIACGQTLPAGTEVEVEFVLQQRNLHFCVRGIATRASLSADRTSSDGFLLKVTEAEESVRRWIVGLERASSSRRREFTATALYRPVLYTSYAAA